MKEGESKGHSEDKTSRNCSDYFTGMSKDSGVEEVLQWMHLAMGTEPEDTTSNSITAVIGKMQQLKKDNECNKEEAEKYKRELERSTNDYEAQITTKNQKIEQLEDQVNAEKEESKLVKRELERSTNDYEAQITTKNQKIEQLEDRVNTEMEQSKLAKEDLETTKSNELTLHELIVAKDAKIAELEKMVVSLVQNNQSLMKPVETSANSGNGNGDLERRSLHARFAEISKMKSYDMHYSKSIRFANADWAIGVCATRHHDEKYLAIYLDVISDIPKDWTCTLRMKVHLVSQSGGKSESEVGKALRTYSLNRKDHGYERFISYKELLKSKNDLVKDDSILVAIKVKIFPDLC